MTIRTPSISPVIFAHTFLGVEPHPTQEEWLEARAKVKTACCGRRWGKSFSEAIDLIWFACAHDDTLQFLFAPTADQSRIIMEYCATLLRNSPARRYVVTNREGDTIRHSPFPEIQFANGSSIHARTAGSTGVPSRGRGADRIILDEKAFIPEKIVRDTIEPYLATSEYAERVNISTPFGYNHFFDDFQCGEMGEPGYFSASYPSSVSPYVNQAYLDQQRRKLTTVQFEVEYEARFAEDQASVFPGPLIQRCIGPDVSDEPQEGHLYKIGFDPAKYTDRSGVVVLDVTTRPFRVVLVLDISGRDYLVQAETINRLAARYNHAEVLLDSTSHDQMLEELRRSGTNAGGFLFTNTSKQELINGLVIGMEQENVQFPNHRDLVTELIYYRYELTAAGNVKLGAEAHHHDDLVTALALAVWCARIPEAGALLTGGETRAPMPGTFAARLKNKQAV